MVQNKPVMPWNDFYLAGLGAWRARRQQDEKMLKDMDKKWEAILREHYDRKRKEVHADLKK